LGKGWAGQERLEAEVAVDASGGRAGEERVHIEPVAIAVVVVLKNVGSRRASGNEGDEECQENLSHENSAVGA
jgi:hypothetical protein